MARLWKYSGCESMKPCLNFLKVKQVSLFKQALNQNHFSTKKHNYE